MCCYTVAAMRGNEQNVDDSMVIPTDTAHLYPSKRLSLMQKIEKCETWGDLLDISVIDQLLFSAPSEGVLHFSNLFYRRRPFVPILWEIYRQEGTG